MIEISFAAGMVTVLLGWIAFRAAAFRKNKRFDWKNEARQIIFLINLLVIVRFTFYPFSKINGQIQPLIFDIATAYPFRMNLVPFVNLLDYDSVKDLIINIPGNIGMFIPTGIVLPLIYRNLDSFKKVVLTGSMISLVIEMIQLPFAVRASDVDDFILNTLGCMIGYRIFALFRKNKNRSQKER